MGGDLTLNTAEETILDENYFTKQNIEFRDLGCLCVCLCVEIIQCFGGIAVDTVLVEKKEIACVGTLCKEMTLSSLLLLSLCILSS
jgi:hypothetical protein